MTKRTVITNATMVLAAGFCVLFIGGGARFAIGLTLKSVVEELGWGRSDLGMAVALFQIVSAACLYVAGRLADRMSPRVVLGLPLFLSLQLRQPGQRKRGSPQGKSSSKSVYRCFRAASRSCGRAAH